jgi:K+-transporting ATPase ATPase C chain
MLKHIRANLWLTALTLGLCCVAYPAVVLAMSRVLFPHQGAGSLLDEKGRPVTDPAQAVGSRLIAQPFSDDRYFQPRPSATSPSYNAAASTGSNWGANNYLLRDRVTRILGPIVKYADGPKKGQLVGPDIEGWFRKDLVGGKDPGIVAQWAKAHPVVAQNWVKADKLNGDFVAGWMGAHAEEVAGWVKDNPETPAPKPEDVAVPFFESYSKTFPGTWPVAVEHKAADGKTEKRIEPVREGSDIQSSFFDLWRQEHPDVPLEKVPADMVMASGSGLDPHITLQNALYQLDRVAAAWARESKRDEAQVRRDIEQLVRARASAPLGGLVGVPLVNVLETNLALRNHFGSPDGAHP